ncbi:peptidoglycan DD-metalloendopeptidase family protein [Lyngbya aestuarii]|uniref:peptidoglycan DD-metalloendopeptidase family protein n=1 Tax=Lyngbya aestuarii TaxID=118322 RepID=UPI00403DD924
MKKANSTKLLTLSLIGLMLLKIVGAAIALASPQPVTNRTATTITEDSATSNSAQYIWPTQGEFGAGFVSNSEYLHEGIDIVGAIGTPIVAAAAGEVVFAGFDEYGFGNLVEIKHPDGTLTKYAHNNRILVRKGQQVSQGEIIAEMGDTGKSIAPHLHFEVHPAGQEAVDPLPLLPPLLAGVVPSLPKSLVSQSTGSNSPQFIWPSQGNIVAGYVTDPKQLHQGIDIAAPLGSPILAAAAGEVIYAGPDSSGRGKLIEIKHPDGSLTRYGINSRIFVSQGQKVNQGQIIADIEGNADGSTPHLDFEIYYEGQGPVNPYQLLPRRF